MLVAFAPWSLVIGFALWFASGRRMREDLQPTDGPVRRPPLSSYRFLWCWLGVWLVFFSIAATKLPNYVLPAYPVLALFTARFLVRWSTGAVQLGNRWPRAALVGVVLLGVLISGVLLVVSGALRIPAMDGRTMPELLPMAAIGLLPVIAAIWLWRKLQLRQYPWVIWGTAWLAVTVASLMAALGPLLVDRHKVPRAFAAELAAHRVERDIEIACVGPYQPGFVFYTGHHINWLPDNLAIDLLRYPCQTFLIVPANQWEGLRRDVKVPTQIVARRRDFASGREMLLITNRVSMAPEAQQTSLPWPTLALP
jgi:hypothetical protein